MRFCMDWRNLNFDWNRARAFLVTAEEGSFSAAARALRSTQPTVGRQVSALEDELRVTLFERTSAGLVLTQSGLELLEHVRVMAAALQTSFAAAGQSRAVEGEHHGERSHRMLSLAADRGAPATSVPRDHP